MKFKMKTMDDVHGDGSNHECCSECGFCVTCGDCEKYGCKKHKK